MAFVRAQPGCSIALSRAEEIIRASVHGEVTPRHLKARIACREKQKHREEKKAAIRKERMSSAVESQICKHAQPALMLVSFKLMVIQGKAKLRFYYLYLMRA